MSPEQKWAALLQLARKRRRDHLEGYCRLSDFHGGYYECCFVSPWTKSAHNVDAVVMLLGQDWSSSESLKRPRNHEMRKIGQTWNLPTNRNLREFLFENLGFHFCETYTTNVFPFIKNGGLSSRIPIQDMLYGAKEYAIPQIEIVAPKIAICLGRNTVEAIRRSLIEESKWLSDPFQPGECITFKRTEIYGLPHPGSLGTANAGGKAKVHKLWFALGNRLRQLRSYRVG